VFNNVLKNDVQLICVDECVLLILLSHFLTTRQAAHRMIRTYAVAYKCWCNITPVLRTRLKSV